MKRLVVAILAHVDSGKTTLSEGLLYAAGEISSMGRVDHGDAFLDTNEIEKDRGITIFSKQAVLSVGDTKITLLDTPGHIDFSAEMERTLQVPDYAILVVSGSDGVQSHTETLWRLLYHYGIPTFVFVNKMDLAGAEKSSVLVDLKSRLDEKCVDFSDIGENFFEEAAVCDYEMLDEYMDTGTVSEKTIKKMISARRLFPCFFGSALKNEGVSEFLNALDRYTEEIKYGDEFGARIFKISEDEKGQRLTHMKLTGGKLSVKTLLSYANVSEKVHEIRIYSGEKFQNVQEVYGGDVCAVTGLSHTAAGEGLGNEQGIGALASQPLFAYSVKLTDNCDIRMALAAFKKLGEEETGLNVSWNERDQRVNVQIMGEVQLEVLKRILKERFNIDAEFEHGSIIYKETIENTVEGVGHYEPLRHYAEVHLLVEPGKRGSGIVLESKCSEDVLDKNYQRLILTHLEEKTHLGVLTGYPLTDVKITLINGRAHNKHTEGGDFRQATYRAVRQGLMQAKSVILEPYYSVTLTVPTETTGRAMTDLQQMGAEIKAPKVRGEMTEITASVPVAAMRGYLAEVVAYTRGRGRLSCVFKEYAPCKNQTETVEKIGYECESDTENTPDSIFCTHGSGFVVKWYEVFDYMHIPMLKKENCEAPQVEQVRRASRIIADEEELRRIFERTYGKSKSSLRRPMRKTHDQPVYKAKPLPDGERYLLIDGYNIIFAWEELKSIAEESLEDARALLVEKVCNYQVMRQNNVILVFDAYRVKGTHREVEKTGGISVVYTKEAETADSYIEKATKKLCKKNRVCVATSDNLEQMIIFGHGAQRITAAEFKQEVEAAEEEILRFIKENNEKNEKNERKRQRTV
ncbi:MAG: TetM/TetW/TetO/TetS family tetracycline resistance ribosomal protection protein [Firmicutes bacterium]|nr:TetM/TetW/TetO/TetS family tetracycline resistance ribosomal protection protein [Bacillota bacterium]